MLCVSVPCDKSLCGWSGLPCGWGYSYCGRGKSPRSCSGLPCGKGHAELCSTNDLQVHSDWVIGRLPFACRIVAVIVAHPGSTAGLLGAMLHGTIWNR